MEHACAVTVRGGVLCWGNNSHGQLGDGTFTNRNAPVWVSGLNEGVRAVSASNGIWWANFGHTCALLSNGGVVCWGSNQYGQLGDGTINDRLTPAPVTGLTYGVSAITAGSNHTCALIDGGAVKCWGDNTFGQLGDGTTTQRVVPVFVSGLTSGAIAVMAGDGHTCAITAGGYRKCWGQNDYGQLGDGTNTCRLTPVEVYGAGGGYRAISLNGNHTCSLSEIGAVDCWGLNAAGQLGDGTTVSRSIPTAVDGMGGSVRDLSAGGIHPTVTSMTWFGHTCAVMTAGNIVCWGANRYGQLGDGTTVNRTLPAAVPSLPSSVTSISAGGRHTCALLAYGNIMCWGANESGQLGNGTTVGAVVPVAVIGFGTKSRLGLPIVGR